MAGVAVGNKAVASLSGGGCQCSVGCNYSLVALITPHWVGSLGFGGSQVAAACWGVGA